MQDEDCFCFLMPSLPSHDMLLYYAILLRLIPEECRHLQDEMSAEKDEFEIKGNITAKTCLKSKFEKKHHSRVMYYQLGETLRSPTHMIQDPTGVASLNKNDWAFVKRSNGSYSYALVIDRYFDPMANDNDGEEKLVFIVNNKKSTKTCRSRLWSQFIRCVAVNPKNHPVGVDTDNQTRHSECNTSESFVSCHTPPTCVQKNTVKRFSWPLTKRSCFGDDINSEASDLYPYSDDLHFC